MPAVDTATRTDARKGGYAIAALVNWALLYVSDHLLEWEWPPFLTTEFERVLPILRVSLIAGIVVNFAYVLYDGRVFKSLTQVVISALGLAVSVRMLGVFPFDFSAYAFNWEVVARILIILAIVGTAIAILAELAKLARFASGTSDT